MRNSRHLFVVALLLAACRKDVAAPPAPCPPAVAEPVQVTITDRRARDSLAVTATPPAALDACVQAPAPNPASGNPTAQTTGTDAPTTTLPPPPRP